MRALHNGRTALEGNRRVEDCYILQETLQIGIGKRSCFVLGTLIFVFVAVGPALVSDFTPSQKNKAQSTKYKAPSFHFANWKSGSISTGTFINLSKACFI